jgi:hypothetical protein
MAITSFIAGEAISAGNVVYISNSGFLYKANAAYQNQSSVVGIAIDSGVSGVLIRVNSDVVYSSASGLTPGEYRYVSLLTSGDNVSYTVFETQLSGTLYSGAYLTAVGKAVSTSGIGVEIAKPLFINNPSVI